MYSYKSPCSYTIQYSFIVYKQEILEGIKFSEFDHLPKLKSAILSNDPHGLWYMATNSPN